MGTTVIFNPATINCGVIQPGATSVQTAQCGVLSAAVNVTASISADTSGGAITLASIASYVTETQITYPDPGELPGGTKPVPIRTEVPVLIAQSNGVTPLAVASGQSVTANVQFAPGASTPATSSATLLIHGDTWNPVSIPIVATVGKLTASVPSITVHQGSSTSVDVTVTSVAGNGTTAKLIISADGSAEAPNVTVSLNSASFTIDKGKSVTSKLTVSADVMLATGSYAWTLSVWAFDNAYSFSVPVTIKVEKALPSPHYFIKSKLNGHVIDIADSSKKSGASLDVYTQKTTATDNQLWEFLPDPAGSGYYFISSKLNGNVIDIQDSSKKAGALLDAYPKKTTGADNQLWQFISDPGGSGYFFISSKLNGNVIDIQGSSTKDGALLDVYPGKVSNYNNQLWTVVGSSFPSVISTVPPPAITGLVSNHNYFLEENSNSLLGLSVTIDIEVDFISSANGWSIQLNAYSGPSTDSTGPQQYVIYASPGSTQLVARIDNWNSAIVEIVRADVNLANLPTATLPAGYSITISLNNDSFGNITGANYSVKDNTGKSLGKTTIGIVGQTLRTTGNPATAADLAPIRAFQLNIGGDYGGSKATLTSGQGAITYSASSILNVVNAGPIYILDPGAGTVESANLVFAELPAGSSDVVTQSFQITAPSVIADENQRALELKVGSKGHMLPPPGS
jgi:hypothetical protein